ncbi:xanthine dehydrogenase family protein molybdopterin-binding subunit [Sulfitobacter sp. D35]|uniref:xanthine dehydrogenase family protein molybdopterin-binding subunit n=1 Tax=Sulfitobacter sp. D35 TaxID=3083252 RepID=UPI00296EEB19|nr:xanthine dehydrogenase family protein molybdopterin-binding subunit [Sulfitobacter sp. D35]MDW4498543.1 xanthine dehydrogenase family protein molybdopterin-binding subunit [Sulfitobacter sp. D35]
MTVHTPSRRRFLQGAAGLVVAVTLPPRAFAQSGAEAALGSGAVPEGTFAPNAFIRIAPDDTVTVLIKHIEFGQGPNTGLSTLVAEELDADWSQMRAASAPSDNELYKNLAFGMQGTGGSTAMANSYTQMRQAGAAARAMLVAAAAAEWGVPEDEITISKGRITHAGSGNEAGFGAFAEKAAEMTPPAEPTLKTRDQFTLIGTDVPKLDSRDKSTGQAVFTMDVYREGMQTVVVARPPKFGATVASFDDSAALSVDGVEAVRQISSGVAVYATSTMAALRGRDALEISWDESGAETRSSEQMYAEFSAAAAEGGQSAEEIGEFDTALEDAAETVEAEFLFPYLAHAPMEPLDAVLEVKEGKAEMWAGSQFPALDHPTLAQILELDPANIRINVMLAGGSFGRRAQDTAHLAAEVAEIAKAAGGDGCWKLVWTREDDMTGGYYRPLTVHKMQGGLDADGNITAWSNVVVNQSIMAGGPMEAMMQDGMDPTSYEGSTKMPYDLPAARVSWVRQDSAVPVLWWRSVGHTHTGYATEVFLDMLLEKGGKDPVQGRLDLMTGDTAARDKAVLERVAEMAGWNGEKVKNGKGYGVAVHESFSTYVAQIVEVSDEGGMPRVHKVWCAVDCGVAVNPNVIRAQIEGGIGYGLGSILFDAVTLEEGGTVVETNFDTYRMLRINEMPEVEVAIIDSDADPTGIGEPGTPPIGPAVANAWRALTGRNVTKLPFAGNAGV